MNWLSSFAFRTAQRARRSRSMEMFLELQANPRLSQSAARDLQLKGVRKLLDHAERTVPYYREVFQSLGISSRDVRTLDDFAALPVLTKDIVRDRQADLIRTDQPRGTLLAHHSGGSTGVPLTFFRDTAYLDASTAGTWRNLSQSGWRPGDMVAFFWGWDNKLNQMSAVEFEVRQRLRRMYQFDPFKSGPEDMSRWLNAWRRIRPKVILGYASTVARFAEFIEQEGARVAPVAGAFTTAEKLYPQQREVISRVFSCRVYDCYGSSEVQNIAAECNHGSMHIQADYVLLETGAPAAAGESTPLLVTSLMNYAMPFIRYRNEDCGSLVDQSCACGSGFPLMELNVARISDNFVLPGGRVVHGEYFTHLLYGSDGVATFQFHQIATDHIVLRVVPTEGGRETAHRAATASVSQIGGLTGEQVQVSVEIVDSIPLSAAGKHRFTRSDVAPRSVPA